LSEYASDDAGRALAPSAARPQHSPFSRTIQSEGRDRYSRPQLSFDAADPFRRKTAFDLAKERFTKNLRAERTSSAKPRLVAARDEADRRATSSIRYSKAARKGLSSSSRRFSSAHPRQLAARARHPSLHPVREIRRSDVLDAAHVKDLLALPRFVENPRDRSQGSA
jgi:superfamily I DNA/RNA helicase